MSAESVLKELGSYKNKLVSIILDDPDIMELLFGAEYTDEDIDEQVLPYLYADDTQMEVKTYLCVEVDVPRISTDAIKNMKIVVWAYSHRKCMRYNKAGYMGTRPDILCDMVERKLRDNRDFGIGKLRLDSATYISPSKVYYGRQLVFSVPDFRVGRG